MAKSVLDIVIKLSKQGGADKETITGLVKVKSALLDAAAVGGTFVATGFAIKAVLDQTVGKLVTYAANVRRGAEATGMSTEETSRQIQVLDDVKISYSELEKVIQKGAKTYDYSTEGLAKMSGEYLALGSSQDRAKYATERFGKQWITFLPLLKLGENAIKKMNSSVEDGLIITEKANRDTRLYEMSVDKVTDSWDSFTNKIGMAVVPQLAELMSSTELNTLQQKYYAQALEKSNGNVRLAYSLSVQMAKAEWMASAGIDAATDSVNSGTNSYIAMAKAMQGATLSAEDLADAEALYKSEADTLLSTITSLVTANDTYETTMADLNAQLADGKIKQEEYAASATAAAAAQDAATAQIIFNLAQMQLAADGWQASDTAAMLSMGQQLGIFTSQQAASAAEIIANSASIGDAYKGLASVSEAQRPLMENAIDQLTAQFQAGRLTVMQYNQKVESLYNKIKLLDGASATAAIYLIVHGSVPNIGKINSEPGGAAPVIIPDSGGTGTTTQRASGGPLGSNITMVGEKGYELVVQDKNGNYTVIPHEASAWMMRAGMVPDFSAAYGGKMTYTPRTRKYRSRGESSPAVVAAAMSQGGNLTPIQNPATAQAAVETAQTANTANRTTAQNNAMLSAQSQTVRGTENMNSELKKLNSQMRDFRAELPSAVAAAMQRIV